MDFQQFMDIGEKLKLEGKELIKFCRKRIRKVEAQRRSHSGEGRKGD